MSLSQPAVVIIGAGQAGLAMSRCLSDRGIDHIVLDRGTVGQRWRSHGWDSLRLLTPNWMTRLPGFQYSGDEPDGFMSAAELVAFLETYAERSRTPLVPRTTVQRVDALGRGFRVLSNRGAWHPRAVVIATGHAARPFVPAMSAAVASSVLQIAPAEYRNPNQLPPGGVLIVGASSTGVQLADEIQQSGRQVTLAVGRHTRLPRRYRGRDILWWLDRLGALSESAASVHNLNISRHQPSLQLVGRPDRASLDLRVLHKRGVRITGRIRGIDGSHVYFDDDLAATAAGADIKMAETLRRIDAFITDTHAAAARREPFEPTWPLAVGARTELDLEHAGIATVIWATGYRRSYSWLRVPVLNAGGEIIHEGGITPVPGLYVLGLNFQRRRHSSFIDGVGSDANELAHHIAAALDRQRVA